MNFCKKLLCVAISMVFVTASMYGCGSQGVASSGGNASQAEGPVELSAMVMQSRYYTGLQKMVAKLSEDENITIDFQVIPDDQFDNILKMKVNSGEAPDIIAYNYPHLFAQINPEEYLVPLTNEEWTSKLKNPGTSTRNGEIYGFTFQESDGFQGMIYNVDVFEQFNLKVPKTVEELDQIVGTLLDNGITPIALPSDNWVPQIWMTSGFSRALGTDEACEEATNKILTNQAVFNDYPEFAMVIDDYLKMFDKGYFNSDYLTVDYDTVLDRLVTGETAMLYGATSILNTIQSSYPDANLEMFNPPVSYDQKDLLSTCYYSFGLGIPKTSKNIDAVKKVFQLWSTPEYCDLFFEDQPGFPNLEGVNGNQQQFSSSVNEIYEDYVGSGRTVTEMNEHWGTIQPLFATKLWVYYLEAPSKGNMDGKAILERSQEDVAQYMTEKKAEGWS